MVHTTTVLFCSHSRASGDAIRHDSQRVLDMRWTAGEKLGLRVNDESNSVTRVESNSPAQRALSSEASRLQALISGEGVDVKGDIVKRLSAGEPETINFLSAMYPAAKTSKCLVCDKKFTLGGSSECLMLHKGEFCDYERKFCGHSEFGGTFSGQCKFCGEHVSAHGGEDDGPNPEDFGKCYCGPHVTSHDAVNKLKIQLRKERMELREFFEYMLEEHRELVTAEVEAEFPKHLSHWSKAPATVKQWFDAL